MIYCVINDDPDLLKVNDHDLLKGMIKIFHKIYCMMNDHDLLYDE